MTSTKSILMILATALLAWLAMPAARAQSYAFGVKGGPSLCFQRWGEGNRDVLWAHHATVFIESAPPISQGVIYAQAGYHVRGSALRFQAINVNNIFLGHRTDEFCYNNRSVAVGFK